MRTRKKPKRTPIQKQIMKDLIDAEINMTEIAAWHGHTPSNSFQNLYRQNEDYFYEAIEGIQKEREQAESDAEVDA